MSETVIPNSAPKGGTELIAANIRAALPELCEQVQIIMSRPEQVPFEDKPRILVLQDLPQDPASQCLRDPSYRTNFNKIVFVSHWQQQMYNLYLGIPYSEGIVIKNAVPRVAPQFPKLRGEKLKFVYTSTPHRGLALLAAAADALAEKRQDWELHVYSSFNIYGWHDADKQFTPLYDQLRKNPCVVYHGSVPNPEIRTALLDSHVFVYPSIYQETSCMAIQEALMSGCLAITSNFGALPETCGEWAWMFRFSENPEEMIALTLTNMERALELYDTPELQQILELQSYYYQTYYSLEVRIAQWKSLLEHVIAQGVPDERVIIG